MKLMLGLCEFKLSMHLGAKKKFGVQVVYIMYIITNCLFKPLISLLSSFLVSYIERSHTIDSICTFHTRSLDYYFLYPFYVSLTFRIVVLR